jgi:CHASE2 domain-containing sensor protein
MEGLRTTLPGVQVLFGFLLTIALQPGFDRLEGSQRTAYYIAFFGTALASVLFIAPSVHQRLRAPADGIPRRSELHVRRATQLAIAGSLSFAAALMAAVLLVSSEVLPFLPALLFSGVVAGTLVWTWFYMPLVQFDRE